MPHTNPFFSTTTSYSGEVNLVDDLVREQIKIYGVDFIYMPRYMINLDDLLHEATKSVFGMGLPMPMYIKSFDGYDQSMEMLTKFGVRSSDELTLVISRSEWTAYYAPFVKGYFNDLNQQPPASELDPLKGETARRPMEGDLIFNPFDQSIFEVKYVQFDQPFFTLGKGYIFELQCEKFEYSGERFDTGIDKIDDVQDRRAYYELELNLMDNGSGTFKLNEKVTMYNIKKGSPALPDSVETTVFEFYNDAGFLEEVDSVKGIVYGFDKPRGQLRLGELSNLNPDKQMTLISNPIVLGDYEGTEYPDDYYEAIFNDFDFVLVVGENGGEYISMGSKTAPTAFDDSDVIQSEFDKIKILDLSDQNPFGFY
jgi:hypothetical protein